jgi:hypothetical protein
VQSELQRDLGNESTPPSPDRVRSALRRIVAAAPEAPVIYYLDDEADLLAVGGGPMGAPRPPWYVRYQLQRGTQELIAFHNELTGRAQRFELGWRSGRYRLGSVAVFYPSYRGRGQSMVRPLKELLVFFLVLFGACGGIVALAADDDRVGELAPPIASARCSSRRIGDMNCATVSATIPPQAPNSTRKNTSSSLSGHTIDWPRPR